MDEALEPCNQAKENLMEACYLLRALDTDYCSELADGMRNLSELIEILIKPYI